MRTMLAFGAGALALACAGAAMAAPSVEIRNAAARVVVIPEARSDIKVEYLTTNAALPLSVRSMGERTVIDGGLSHRIGDCGGVHLDFNINHKAGRIDDDDVMVHGVGRVTWKNLPQVVIRVPLDAHVSAGGAVFGSVGRSDSLDLSNSGCGNWTIGNVKGDLRISQAGSGDAHAGAAGSLKVSAAGSGDVSVKQVSGGATVQIAGSGDVSAQSVSGPVKVDIAGSGDVDLGGGHATELVAHIAGSGDVKFAGTADSLDASIAGSGDVDVDRVTGTVHKAVMGSGDVNVGGHTLSRDDNS